MKVDFEAIPPPVAKWFDFNAEDLMTNRLGQISERQRGLLRQKLVGVQGLFFIIGVGLVIFGFVPHEGAGGLSTLWVLLTTGRAPTYLASNEILIWLCVRMPLMAGLGVLLTLIIFVRLEYKFQKVTGLLRLREVPARRRKDRALELIVGGRSFGNVWYFLGEFLHAGETYTAYYAKSGAFEHVLAVEPGDPTVNPFDAPPG